MENSNNWQRCPVCNGSGMVDGMYGSGPCNTCSGHGIINTYDGSAPNWQKYQTTTGSTTNWNKSAGNTSGGEWYVIPYIDYTKNLRAEKEKKDIAYAIIPDAERLDIGTNKPVAVFKHMSHAKKFANNLYKEWYIIEEIKTDIFYENTNM